MKKFILLFSLICIIFIGCNKQAPEEIKIGVILPLTGQLSKMGEMERNAMELAVNQIAIDSNIKVQLYFEDNQSKSTNAVSAVNKLLTVNKVDAVVTSTTGASLAVQPILEKNKKAHFAFCMDTDISSLSQYTVRYYMGLEQEIEAILNYVNENDNHRIAVLCCKIPAYETLVNKFISPYFKENNNNKLVYLDYYELNQTDFRAISLQLKNQNIDDLILLGYGFEYHNIYKQFIEQKILNTFQIIGGWGFLYTELDDTLLEGTLVAGPEYVFNTTPVIDEFKKSYKNKYKIMPNFDAAFAYELIYRLPTFKLNNKTNIKETIKNISMENSVVGNYSFDMKANMILQNVGLGIYKNGNLQKIK